jgi:hypothetical protein
VLWRYNIDWLKEGREEELLDKLVIQAVSRLSKCSWHDIRVHLESLLEYIEHHGMLDLDAVREFVTSLSPSSQSEDQPSSQHSSEMLSAEDQDERRSALDNAYGVAHPGQKLSVYIESQPRLNARRKLFFSPDIAEWLSVVDRVKNVLQAATDTSDDDDSDYSSEGDLDKEPTDTGAKTQNLSLGNKDWRGEGGVP